MILWDEHKRLTNLAKHGLDFADLDYGFFENATVYEGLLGRHVAVGWFGDMVITVVFKFLGEEALSVISMRPASKKERNLI